jgi:hypothetical protein
MRKAARWKISETFSNTFQGFPGILLKVFNILASVNFMIENWKIHGYPGEKFHPSPGNSLPNGWTCFFVIPCGFKSMWE